MEQRAWSREHGAESMEQRAWSRESPLLILFRYALCPLPYAIMSFQRDPDQKVVTSMIEKHMKGVRKEGEGPYSLIESLDLRGREVVSLAGAGGKTTLCIALQKNWSWLGKKW